MEEILSSIRRIIAEDEPGAQAAGSGSSGEPLGDADLDDEDDDVLELTEIVGEPDPPALEAVAAAPPKRPPRRCRRPPPRPCRRPPP